MLPGARPELNLIVRLWAQIKSKCAKGNQEGKLAEPDLAAREHFEPLSLDRWENLERHDVDIEDKYTAIDS